MNGLAAAGETRQRELIRQTAREVMAEILQTVGLQVPAELEETAYEFQSFGGDGVWHHIGSQYAQSLLAQGVRVRQRRVAPWVEIES